MQQPRIEVTLDGTPIVRQDGGQFKVDAPHDEVEDDVTGANPRDEEDAKRCVGGFGQAGVV